MLEFGTKLLLSYLLGSVNGSLLLGWLRGFDIRTEGSGNAGATNALRTHGFLFALLVMLIDVGKGVAAVLLVAPMDVFAMPLLQPGWTAAACGVAAVVGHIAPFWFDFRGGKGGATAVGALLGLWPLAVLPVAMVWLVVLTGTGFVGFATMCAAVTMPLFVLLYQPAGPDLPLLFYGAAIAALVVYAHRSNIANMRSGTENRMAGAMFWRRKA
ncbi:MAG: glycerol-3-phosphate 1-O-acyltransferase PlsY [Gammaproteobacteria bacterium]|nr:glycerol-3-phosphate 1-O-acyltransferase PlsY [Gammaproteobacteria bacterium]NNM20930.1 glycerol-3-phosphate 1-O-acyltransferase PlsY [Gammaproteobacteria bacterium]